jgi:hypothetical protein
MAIVLFLSANLRDSEMMTPTPAFC